MIKCTWKRNKHTATIKICKLASFLVSKLSPLKSANLPLTVKHGLGPKFLEAPKTFFAPLKEGKSTAGHHQPCLPPQPETRPHVYKEIRAQRIPNRFLTLSLNFASFCLSDTTYCAGSLIAHWCLFLCYCPSHKALSQMVGSSAGTSKEKGRSGTTITLLEPNPAKQEIPWFNINDHFPWVENQHFTSYSK